MNDYSNFDCDTFSCTYEGHTAVVCLKSESFKMAMDASKMHEMLECLNAIELDQNIKGILTMHMAEYERIEVLQDFIKSIQKHSGYVQKEMGVTRYGNAVKRLTLAINEFSKPSVVAVRGKVSIDSFGYFLACDYRIASDDLSIEFPGLQIGVTPAGAVSFYMSRQLGTTRTMELLMSGNPISAEGAKELSMISKVVPDEQLKAASLAKLEEMYKVPGSTLNLTKQLTRPKTYELEEHFELSSRLMWNSIIDN
ncbi:MAG: enoyl-CoA hydratase/isomerase family protein [Gammaproteobacteria bacterium]|nr:enoyl-CoA hydratase/isomerase family protein [Gammaproteobacteria bacterium]